METPSIPMVNLPQTDDYIITENSLDAVPGHSPVQDEAAPTRPSLASANLSGTSIMSETMNAEASTSTTSAPTPSTTITAPSFQQTTFSIPPTAHQPQQQTPSIHPSLDPESTLGGASNHRSRAATFSYWLRPLVAIVVYAVTLGIAFNASQRYTLLGRVSASLGIWFLAILAKAGDLYFAFAVADAFDCIAWGKLKKAEYNPSGRSLGLRLDGFLSLISSTGVVGLSLIVWKNLVTLWKRRRTWSTIETTPWTRCREMWKHWRPARWSVARGVCLMVLIPGPGIILLGKLGTVAHPSSEEVANHDLSRH
tara:strand:- start:761 stop:1690 length:930 start_codon:yes stop_codon:yes gene_type:complete